MAVYRALSDFNFVFARIIDNDIVAVAGAVNENIRAAVALQSVITLAAVNRIVLSAAEDKVSFGVADNFNSFDDCGSVNRFVFAFVIVDVKAVFVELLRERNFFSVGREDLRISMQTVFVSVSNDLAGGVFESNFTGVFTGADGKDDIFFIFTRRDVADRSPADNADNVFAFGVVNNDIVAVAGIIDESISPIATLKRIVTFTAVDCIFAVAAENCICARVADE